MLFFAALILLIILPSPWNMIGAAACALLGIGEVHLWNRTVRHRRKAVGIQTFLGRTGIAETACRPTGQVRIDGEIWQARCAKGADAGSQVRVTGIDGLTLVVESAPEP